MVEALGLLCNTELADLVNFDSFFFLTDSLTVGGYITTPTTGNADNISAAVASFRRFSPRSCDLIDVTGTAYFITPGTENSTLQNVEQLNLCTVKAIVFGLADLPDCPDDCPDATYRRAVRTIRRTIRTNGGETSACSSIAGTQVCNSCCCNSGVLTELATRNLSRLATLTAGELVLQNVTVLGSIGSVLILTDSTLERFYFICASQIETLG